KEMTSNACFCSAIRDLSIFLILLSACTNKTDKDKTTISTADDISPKLINYRVVNAFPHDTTAYTEGFLVHNGLLYEATGHTNSFPGTRSLFGVVNLTNGTIDKKAEIDKNKYFGEGIAFLKNRIFQLTDTTR